MFIQREGVFKKVSIEGDNSRDDSFCSKGVIIKKGTYVKRVTIQEI